MTLTVETGEGISNADSYVSVLDAATYAAANGIVWPTVTASAEAALRRATFWIDTTYRLRFPGYRVKRRMQALEWPRIQAYILDNGGNGPSPAGYDPLDYGDPYVLLGQFDYLSSDVVPPEIVRATIEAASREAASPGLLMGDVQVGSVIKKQAAGDTSQEFFLNAATSTTSGSVSFPLIDAILFGILIERRFYTARAVRG